MPSGVLCIIAYGGEIMTTIEYLSLNKGQKFLYKIGNFFMSIPRAIARFFRKVPRWFNALMKKLASPFVTLKDAMVYSDYKVRLSFLICGFGQITRHQIIRGVIALVYELAYIFFMIVVGVPQLSMLGSLGTLGQFSIVGGANANYDNSFVILLICLFSIVFSVLMVIIWYSSVKSAKILYDLERIGHHESDRQYIKDFLGKKFHTILLSVPVLGLMVFTVIPVIYMVLIGFTDYNTFHDPQSGLLFEWVGWLNYSLAFGSSGVGGGGMVVLTTIMNVLLWTLIWAFFATFSNYFIGMIVAILINRKGIKLKKLWRTILVTTIAVPQFISLLLMSQMFSQSDGIFNGIIQAMGGPLINWLGDPIIAKVVIILVNTWIGIPYTMLICSGILMNIPEDLYESAKIDGASPFRTYMRITLPYMLFITGPYLISQFVGNINNFNVIYLLTGGGPMYGIEIISVPQLMSLGQTDLLITWIYKMTIQNASNADYGFASVLGVLVFAIVAFFSLIFYGRSNAVKNEEDFQ